jgi:hypothetical protein
LKPVAARKIAIDEKSEVIHRNLLDNRVALGYIQIIAEGESLPPPP